MKKRIVMAMSLTAMTGVSLAHADSFGFDRPGLGLGTDIVDVGHVAWEQSLPSVSYDDTAGTSTTTLNADALFRIGVGANTEVRVGWDGPEWQKTRTNGKSQTNNGAGDVSLGVKHRINTNDDSLTWAVLGQVTLASGDDEFSVGKDKYTVSSALAYAFSPEISTGITMSYDYQDSDFAWAAIPTIQYKITNKVAGYTEYYYRKMQHQHHESILNNGVIWSVRDNLQLDASIGYSFNTMNPRLTAGLGFAYLF